MYLVKIVLILEYAIKVGPARIHSVDLNPCQNHMLELKLAGLSALDFKDVNNIVILVLEIIWRRLHS